MNGRQRTQRPEKVQPQRNARRADSPFAIRGEDRCHEEGRMRAGAGTVPRSQATGRAKARIERDFLAGEIVACPRVTRSEPHELRSRRDERFGDGVKNLIGSQSAGGRSSPSGLLRHSSGRGSTVTSPSFFIGSSNSAFFPTIRITSWSGWKNRFPISRTLAASTFLILAR